MKLTKYIRSFSIILAFLVLTLVSGTDKVLAINTSPGQALWARSTVVESTSSWFNDTATDSSGNVIAVGVIEYGAVCDFGNGVTATGKYASGYNAVIVKYNSEGVAQWASTPSTAPSESEFYGVDVDGAGNAYASGDIKGRTQYNFGGTATATGGHSSTNALVVKYNPSGAAQWARTATVATNYSFFDNNATDDAGNTYAVGIVNRNTLVNFGDGVTAQGLYATDFNGVVVKYNTAGVAQWAKVASTAPGWSRLNGAAVDSAGDVYVAGNINGNGQFDFGNSVTSAGAWAGLWGNPVLIKYSAAGLAQWARSTTEAPETSGFSNVTVDSSGGIYAVGSMTNGGQFGFGNNVTSTGATAVGTNALVVKYSAEGTAQWARSTISSAGTSWLSDVDTDSFGNIYAVGRLGNDSVFAFSAAVLVQGSNATSNLFLLKYDSDGVAEWAKSTTVGSVTSYGNGVTVDDSDNIYLAGEIDGDVSYTFGVNPDATVAGGSADWSTVLVKYAKDVLSATDTTVVTPTTTTTTPSTTTATTLPETGADLN